MVSIAPELVASRLGIDADAPAKGLALEECIAELFALVPGVRLFGRRVLDRNGVEEVDLFFSNDQLSGGFRFLPSIIPVECKNWLSPVDPPAVVYFAQTLRNRACDHGILVARHGIGGKDHVGATEEVSRALRDQVRILVIDATDLLGLSTTGDLCDLLRRRQLDLVANGAPLLR